MNEKKKMMRLNLPCNLLEEILSRVPATSLSGLRFICKRWNALFKDPYFIKKATKQKSILIMRNFRVYSLSVNLNEIHNNIVVDPSIEFTSKLRSLNESEQVDITEVFHCNGLLLCTNVESYKTKLVVVNPFTGKTRWIQPRSVYHRLDRYALGYEYNNNNNNSYESYKILRFPEDFSQLEIFDLKSNLWRVLAKIPPNEDLCTFGRGLSLKGDAYWMSYCNILSFDFTIERFRRFCYPYPFRCENNIAISVFKEEQISLLHNDSDTLQMEIWVSSKIDTETVFSWSKCFTLDLSYQLSCRFSKKGSFIFDQEKEMVVYCRRSGDQRKNVIYIVSMHGWRKFDYDKDQSNYCYPFVFSYVPSLVSLNPPM
ncbi:F-box/LRR-repeat/kelch-repeat protein [Cardamine amara subsp. amara]|uniref:F-box/LRR-repeat/kelch-repeat protein n=1 Tax=Cardamine amara subsp. amara TaxID=228776 RepID=A0ABD1A9I8_CARAN